MLHVAAVVPAVARAIRSKRVQLDAVASVVHAWQHRSRLGHALYGDGDRAVAELGARGQPRDAARHAVDGDRANQPIRLDHSESEPIGRPPAQQTTIWPSPSAASAHGLSNSGSDERRDCRADGLANAVAGAPDTAAQLAAPIASTAPQTLGCDAPCLAHRLRHPFGELGELATRRRDIASRRGVSDQCERMAMTSSSGRLSKEGFADAMTCGPSSRSCSRDRLFFLSDLRPHGSDHRRPRRPCLHLHPRDRPRRAGHDGVRRNLRPTRHRLHHGRRRWGWSTGSCAAAPATSTRSPTISTPCAVGNRHHRRRCHRCATSRSPRSPAAAIAARRERRPSPARHNNKTRPPSTRSSTRSTCMNRTIPILCSKPILRRARLPP